MMIMLLDWIEASVGHMSWSEALVLIFLTASIVHLGFVLFESSWPTLRRHGFPKYVYTALVSTAAALFIIKLGEAVLAGIGIHLPILLTLAGPFILIFVVAVSVWLSVLHREKAHFFSFVTLFFIPLTVGGLLMKAKFLLLFAAKLATAVA